LTVAVWRIATDAPTYTADDLIGEGARLTGGRWNRNGTPMLYCSGSIALACLETVVHLDENALPLNRYLVRIDVPDGIFEAAMRFDAAKGIGWDAVPEGKVSLDAGDRWIASRASVLMIVPSVIVPEESNLLVSPLHPDAGRLKAHKLRRWTYDSRLRG